MGLDGLGSASYGPEAMLTVLAVAGAANLGAIQPITWIILLLLLAILLLSYWQTIAAYPSNGMLLPGVQRCAASQLTISECRP